MPDITNQVEYVLKVSGANEAAAEIQTLGRAAQQAGAKLAGSDGLSVSTVALGAALGGFAQQAARAAIDALKRLTTDAINLTVEMADLADAMGYIYSDSAPELIEVLDGVSAATGYTREELYGLSRDIGAMIVPMGVASDEAAAMSANIVARAADAAAALGKDLPEASNALEQALRGSSRGARTLGIDISEEAVQAELFAMGINKAASEVDEATLFQARYNLIMDATARYQGAAAAEMDTLEGAQRQVKAAWEEAALTVGEALEPSLTRLLGVVADIIPMGGDLLEGVIQLLDLGFGPLIATLEPTFGLLSIIRDGLQALEDKIIAEVPWISDLAGAWGDLTITWDEAETFLRDLLGLEATVPEMTTSVVTATEQQNTAMRAAEDILAAVRGEAEGLTLAEIALAQATIQAEIALANRQGASLSRISVLSGMLQELETAREAIKAGETTYGRGGKTELTAAGGAGNTELTAEERKAQNAVKWEKELVQLNRERKRLMEEAEQARLEALQEAWDLESELLDQIAEKQNELLEQQQEQRIAEAESRAEELVDLGEGMLNNMDRLDEFVTDMIRRWAEDLIKAFAVQTLADAFTGGLGGKILGFAGGGKSGKLLGGKGVGGFLGGR